MIVSILIVLLYALFAVLILELVFWVVGLFIQVPPKIRQLVYAIVGVCFIIWIVQLAMAAGGGPHFPSPFTRP